MGRHRPLEDRRTGGQEVGYAAADEWVAGQALFPTALGAEIIWEETYCEEFNAHYAAFRDP